jgi:hypothetical protein
MLCMPSRLNFAVSICGLRGLRSEEELLQPLAHKENSGADNRTNELHDQDSRTWIYVRMSRNLNGVNEKQKLACSQNHIAKSGDLSSHSRLLKKKVKSKDNPEHAFLCSLT